MEEKNVTAEPNKLSYEELEKVAMEAQQRMIMMENRLRSIDFASMRLNWLFKVIENKDSFSLGFLEKCVKEVEGLLTLEEDSDNKSAEA